MLRSDNREIEARHGKHYVSSIWGGDKVSKREGIVPEQFQKVRGICKFPRRMANQRFVASSQTLSPTFHGENLQVDCSVMI